MAPTEERGWGEYRHYIVEELKRINQAVEEVNKKIEKFREDDISQIKTDVALLKLQSAMWGAGAGIVFGAVATTVVNLLLKAMH